MNTTIAPKPTTLRDITAVGHAHAVTESEERPPFALTVRELIVLQTLPDAMEALIDWHECQATMADAMDMPGSGRFHDERKAAIRAEVERLEKVREG